VHSASIRRKLRMRLSSEYHRFCVARSIALSTAALAFCILETTLSWKSSPTAYPWPMGTFTLLLGNGVAIAVLIQLTLAFKCLRERTLFLLVLLRILVGLLAGLMPSLFEPARAIIRHGSHLLWLICSAISFSLVVSAVRNSCLSAKSQGG
jgi:hypothetical protein